MPSIPQSLLWISLVVLWLFVLVPMLINKRDTVRRTSDVALATRVLNGGAKSRLIKRSGPAAGHRHDPDWQPEEPFAEDYPYDESAAQMTDYADQRDVIREYDDAVREARMGTRTRSVVVVAAVSERTTAVDSDYLDVDVVEEDSGALPIGGTGMQASLFDSEQETVEPEAAPAEPVVEQPAEPVGAAAFDGTDDEYEYIDDTSGLETGEDLGHWAGEEIREDAGRDAGEDAGEGVGEDAGHHVAAPAAPHSASRQRRMSTATAAAVSARKYRFRKRVLIVMAALMVLSATLSFTLDPTLWWSLGAVAAITVLYLGYLRRQTRIEEQVRRRRQQRMARPRPDPMWGADAGVREPSRSRSEADFADFPTRLQRPGAVVLDIDDEDPIFDHLDEVPYSRGHFGTPGDLPRASGQ